MGIIAGIVGAYIGIEKNSVDGPACCSTIASSFILSFRKLINIKNYIIIYSAECYQKRKILYLGKKKLFLKILFQQNTGFLAF